MKCVMEWRIQAYSVGYSIVDKQITDNKNDLFLEQNIKHWIIESYVPTIVPK